MKSVLVILLILIFVITPAHGQLLSDATGLINRLNVQTSGHDFEIVLTSNFDLLDYEFDKNKKQLILYLESGLEDNLAEIIIPANLLNGDFKFHLNDREFSPRIQSDDRVHFITLNFTGSGSNIISISGSEYLVGLSEIVSEDDLEIGFEVNNMPNSDDSSFLLILLIIPIIVVPIIIFKIKKNKN
jgi:hypothetical protein